MGLVLLAFSIVGCGRKERYQDQFTDVFDTASMVIGYEESEKAFQEKSTLVHETLLHYHKLFDVYTDYPDLENLKKVNEEAGKAPVKVEPEIMSLLQFGKEIYEQTDGKARGRDCQSGKCKSPGCKGFGRGCQALQYRRFNLGRREYDRVF